MKHCQHGKDPAYCSTCAGYQPKHARPRPKHRGAPGSEVMEATMLTPHPKHRKEQADA